MGGSESEESEDEVSSGEDRGAGRGERVSGSMAREFGRDLVFGERERRFRVACVGRGLVGARFRDVAVVFADDVRENGGATEGGQSTSLFWDIDTLPVGRLGVPGTLGSFLGTGESFRDDRADANRGPPPPEPVLRIASPPADSDVLPGIGDGAADPFDTPTFRI